MSACLSGQDVVEKVTAGLLEELSQIFQIPDEDERLMGAFCLLQACSYDL